MKLIFHYIIISQHRHAKSASDTKHPWNPQSLKKTNEEEYPLQRLLIKKSLSNRHPIDAYSLARALVISSRTREERAPYKHICNIRVYPSHGSSVAPVLDPRSRSHIHVSARIYNPREGSTRICTCGGAGIPTCHLSWETPRPRVCAITPLSALPLSPALSLLYIHPLAPAHTARSLAYLPVARLVLYTPPPCASLLIRWAAATAASALLWFRRQERRLFLLCAPRA